jgi:hypothetical protein
LVSDLHSQDRFADVSVREQNAKLVFKPEFAEQHFSVIGCDFDLAIHSLPD